jgi:hypothetical protein
MFLGEKNLGHSAAVPDFLCLKEPEAQKASPDAYKVLDSLPNWRSSSLPRMTHRKAPASLDPTIGGINA